ncbi:hypothetical protein WR25_01291 [Diploscapter pachys]|uniref:Uncharacterized protein n=1 Tax=Diploscapter pachys TaxID=2018661 RepID=A0A2A2J3M2_9BILA|nr:hypothetical protein WR25_01291 [Diploscapter pachys]
MNPSSSSYLYPGSPPAISLSSPNTVSIASPSVPRKAKTSSTNNNNPRESEWSLSRILKFFSRAIPDSSESSSTQLETTTQIPEPEIAETLETTQSPEPQVEPRRIETESEEIDTSHAPLNNIQISEIIIRQPEGQPESDIFKLLANSPKAMAKTTQSLLKALYDVAPEFVNSQDFVIKFERAGDDNDKVKKI